MVHVSSACAPYGIPVFFIVKESHVVLSADLCFPIEISQESWLVDQIETQ